MYIDYSLFEAFLDKIRRKKREEKTKNVQPVYLI